MTDLVSPEQFAVKVAALVERDDGISPDRSAAELVRARDRAVAKKVLEGLANGGDSGSGKWTAYSLKKLANNPAKLDRLMGGK